jgi:hypothetical protein
MQNLCYSYENNIHIFPKFLKEIEGTEDERNSAVINHILDVIDNTANQYSTIIFHIRADDMKFSEMTKYKKIVSLFIQIVSVKYETTILDKCYVYDVNRAMKAILELINPILPKQVKSNLIIVKSNQEPESSSSDDKED